MLIDKKASLSMSPTLKKQFISKKIPMSLEGKSFSSLPKIIRSHEIREIYQVQQMINAAKLEIEEYKYNEMQNIEERRVEIENAAKENVLNEALQHFDDFQTHRNKYFNNVEEHCIVIVKKAISTMLNDMTDDERVRVSVQSAIEEVKGQSDVVLKVNPSHELSVSDMVADRGWEVKFDRSLALDECQIDVPLGGYRSSFTYRFDLLCNAIDASGSD
ncbi:MAG: hypothetical protein ACJAUP_001765 [Cellvibrionaceae bacterium]|jgi:hypothetical protein